MGSLTAVYGALGVAVIAALVLPITLGAIFVIIAVATRSEPDPSGRRPVSVFMLATSFVTLFIALFSSVVTVAALVSLIGHRTAQGGGSHPVGDQVARIVVISLLLVISAGAAFAVHLPRALAAGRSEVAETGSPAGPVARVWQSYAAAVSFVCVLLAVGASVLAVYQLFRLAGPGVFQPGSNSRVGAVRVLLPSLYLVGAALLLMLWHQRISLVAPAPAAPTPTGEVPPAANPYGDVDP